MKTRLFFFLPALCAALCGHFPANAANLASFAVDNKKEIITFNLPDARRYKVFTVPAPDRLVIDVPSVPGDLSLTLPASYKGRLIKAARFGQFDPKTSRFVFDLHKAVRITDVKKSGQKTIKLVVSIEEAGKGGLGKKMWSFGETGEGGKTAAPAAAKKVPPKPVVVIDAGHGGVDPGAIGYDGTQEKDVVLQYAKALKAKLLKTGRYNVAMTRSDDRFLMLRKRVAIARQAKGDLFISLHADSGHGQKTRGLSVYTLSEQASDKESAALAARENKSDIIAGIDLSDEREEVADILISLAQRETKNRSATFADFLVTRLDDKVKLLPNSHRFAGFAVLKAPDIPSVLIELGFLSHKSEVKQLKSSAHRDRIVSGIASGIDAYFEHRRKYESE